MTATHEYGYFTEETSAEAVTARNRNAADAG